jgi:hypothetical protein
MNRSFLTKLLFLLLACVTVHKLSAQTTQASIIGIITDENKKPVQGATVQLVNESTGFTTATLTNAKGEYIFKELPLGGPYTIKATSVGYGEQKRTDYALNQGDLLRVNISMQVSAANMSEVTITANGQRKKSENFGAATSVTARDISRLPVNGRNFTTLIDLSPLSSGSNLAGQLGSSTNITIDGTSAKNPTSSSGTNSRIGGPYAVSMEAIREFKVVTNQYDVTYGRSGGGTISTVTKSGTNTYSGSVFMFSRADWLSSKYDMRGNRRVNDFSTNQYGFSLGGPIIKNKAHFFIAWDRQDDARPLQIADIQSTADERRFSIQKDTLKRVLDIARSKYGVSKADQTGSFNKKRHTDAAFLRVDWQLNEKNLLTLRDNYVNDRAPLGRDDNSAINLYEVYADAHAWNNSFLATLRTVVNSKLTNELKLQHLYTFEESTPGSQLPKQNIPRGIVERIGSTSEGTNLNTTIQFGGQRYSPEHFYNNVFQLVNNVYYNTNKFNFTFGTDIQYTHMNSLYGSEMNGRFHFDSIRNFNNLTPYRFAREVALEDDPSVDQNVLNAALYAQMKTQLMPGLDMTAGLRADYTNYFNKPNFNQLVFNELGLTTNRSLRTFQVQPRIQFNWDINEKHRDYIRLGAGVFGSDINNYAMINNMVFDGTKVLSVDIRSGIPTPDFPGYRSDPSAAPGRDLLARGVPTINMNGADARIPVVYKANLSYSRFITNNLKLGATFYATLARNNYMYVDRNMADEPFFRLSNEGNRGVYVPSVEKNGTSDWMTGRKSTSIGRVLELNSEGKINQFAVVFDGTWRYFRDGEVSFSYTWNDSKDNTSYNGDVANTATLNLMVNDDPRDLSRMTYSDGQFRHKVVFYGTLPTFFGVSVGVRYSGIGGTRYSLAVNGNINGDFVASNDLAYIFDVNDTKVPEKYRTAINHILNNPAASNSVKDYINKSLGKIAERNGGINRFYGTWDLRFAKKFNVWKKQYIELSGDIFNVENLLNKTWGSSRNLGKQSIYGISGFDQNTNNFNYTVGGNTGVITPGGNPWQIQIGIRCGF